MPQVDVPNQFGDPTLTPEEAASACGPAAAVAFARANGRNPTLREALDLAKRVGWTAAGGMNGIGNQKRLLDAMGIPAELDTNADPSGIRRRVQAGQDVTVSTPVHYYVIDAVDDRGRVHVGQSGLARRGGAEWMTLEDIANRDGGINGALYQTVADQGEPTGGGAGVDTSGDRPPSEFDTTPPRPAPQAAAPAGRGIYDRVVAVKGDPISIRPAPGQETIRRTAYDKLGDPSGTEIVPNPNPVYRYTFADGTYVDADSTTVGGSDLSIKGGTALASVARQPGSQPTTVNTSANEQYIVTRMPDGSLKREPNPNYVAPKAPATPTKPPGTILGGQTPNEQYITIVNPDGTVTQHPNPNYVAPKGSGKTTHTVGGRLYTVDADGNVVNSQDLRTPDEIAKGQLDLQKGQVDLQAAKQKLLPAAQQVMQGLHDSITYLQGLYEKGQIQLPEMNAYVQMFKDAADAQLRGTTPADEAAAKQKAKQADQTLGMNLLNQRLVSGTGLAKSLMDSALGDKIMLRPGQTSLGIDPLSSLLPLLNQLGGGSDIPGYARGLLMGAQGGAPPATGPAPAGL